MPFLPTEPKLTVYYHSSDFLIELHAQAGTSIKAPFLVCDNQGLVKSLSKFPQFTNIFPNTTMEAKWDCIAQILQSTKAL